MSFADSFLWQTLTGQFDVPELNAGCTWMWSRAKVWTSCLQLWPLYRPSDSEATFALRGTQKSHRARGKHCSAASVGPQFLALDCLSPWNQVIPEIPGASDPQELFPKLVWEVIQHLRPSLCFQGFAQLWGLPDQSVWCKAGISLHYAPQSLLLSRLLLLPCIGKPTPFTKRNAVFSGCSVAPFLKRSFQAWTRNSRHDTRKQAFTPLSLSLSSHLMPLLQTFGVPKSGC